jgi:hypothetical chaperone protein
LASLGIDFGTSNCTAYVADQGQVIPVVLDGDDYAMPSVVFTARREIAVRQIEDGEFDRRLRKARAEQAGGGDGAVLNDAELERVIRDAMRRESLNEAQKAYWDQSFFSMLENGQAIIYGNAALRAYFSDPLGGVLVRSPKSFLGSDIHESHLSRFEDIVTAMLGHIKRRGEMLSGSDISTAVMGRPVRYHGTRGDQGNNQALQIMARAADRAGFKDVRFVLEPVSAAYEYETAIAAEQKLLVIDVGGGTTDCVVMRIGPERRMRKDRLDDILGVSGDRIGGTDFDEALAWSALMPAFGKNSVASDGRPLPHSLVHDAVSIRNLPAQIRFAKAENDIRELMGRAKEPEKWARLLSINREQLQYRLVHSAEQGKISLTRQEASEIPLDYVERQLKVCIDRAVFADATDRLVGKVRSLAREAITAAACKPDVVFLTGGMAYSPVVSAAVAELLGNDIPIRSGDMLGSVGRGLGLAAQRSFF